MYVSALTVGTLIVEPLRYFFSVYTEKSKFYWNPDEKLRTVDVGYVNDLNKSALNERPRILIDRGDFNINKTSLSDNLYDAKPFAETKGLVDRRNLLFYQGQATVIIEATQEGSCEVLTDMVSHFILWSRPYICDSQGFKEFGLPMQISRPTLDQTSEGSPKFKVEISVPYMREEGWQIHTDGIKIKEFIYNLTNNGRTNA